MCKAYERLLGHMTEVPMDSDVKLYSKLLLEEMYRGPLDGEGFGWDGSIEKTGLSWNR